MTPFIEDKDLARLLILTPYRPSISDPTIALLDSLTRCGASCLKLPGCSDIALARNLLAQGACEFIGKSTQDIEVVLWLDADMFAERDTIFRQLAHLVELELDGMVAVSGMYTRRREANVLTAARVENQPCKVLADGTIMVPAHTGLGCLMQSAVSFVCNCGNAEQLVNEHGQTFPAICKTGPRTAMRSGEAVRCWGQEDWWYCERLWQSISVAVYVDTSCAWGHLAESLSLPVGIPAGLLLGSEAGLLPPQEGGSSERTP
jgi:hypothetical protein